MADDANEFLKSCFVHIHDADPDRSVPFVLVSNDWSETVVYAEGFCLPHKPWWGQALKCHGTQYLNTARQMIGFESKPFAPSSAKPMDDVTIFFTPGEVTIHLAGGLKILNPLFSPRYNAVGTSIWAGVLFGLEEVPDNAFDKAHYPRTLWSLSLQKRTLAIPVPR